MIICIIIQFTWLKGNICCLSSKAATGRNSASENSRHKFFNLEWTSGNPKLDMFRTPKYIIYILKKCQNKM